MADRLRFARSRYQVVFVPTQTSSSSHQLSNAPLTSSQGANVSTAFQRRSALQFARMERLLDTVEQAVLPTLSPPTQRHLQHPVVGSGPDRRYTQDLQRGLDASLQQFQREQDRRKTTTSGLSSKAKECLKHSVLTVESLEELRNRHKSPSPPPAALIQHEADDEVKSKSEETKKAQPKIRYRRIDCVICQSALKVGTKVTELPCSHFFCNDCIMQWLSTKLTCPTCRQKVSVTAMRARSLPPEAQRRQEQRRADRVRLSVARE